MAETGDIPAQLDALRASGAAERDPIRFAYLDALARRAAAQPDAIRLSLNAKISASIDELASRPAQAPTDIVSTHTASPLADLLTYIGQQAHDQPRAARFANEASIPQRENFRSRSKNGSQGRSRQAPELKSVAYFRNEWAKLSTEQQLTQTLAQAPDNAGPMNSQHLVLRALKVMRDRSPDYLQGFMSYVDTLIWLEHASPFKPNADQSPTTGGSKKAKATKRNSATR